VGFRHVREQPQTGGEVSEGASIGMMSTEHTPEKARRPCLARYPFLTITRAVYCVLLELLSLTSANAYPQARFVANNDVTWTTLGRNENDSMPIGNGDLAANVWTEQNGDLVLLVSKADAWTALNNLVKLGRVRVRFTPNPFLRAKDFKQSLRLEDATVAIRSGGNFVQVWVDANHPVLHVRARLDHPTTVQAIVELWRTKSHPYDEPSPDKGGLFGLGNHPIPLDFEADTVLPPGPAQVAWFHFNKESVFPIVLHEQHLDLLAQKYPDPLLDRCFGAALTGPGLVSDGNRALKSVTPARDIRLDLTALTTTQTQSPEAWQAQLIALLRKDSRTDPVAARAAHEEWWRDFWNRSWIHLSGTQGADKVSQGFAIQRYMMAASSRGAFPTKFNGGLFTVGHDMRGAMDSTTQNHNPDFRAWGGSYWNQNNRLLYWPLIQTGDFDLIKPWFDMYLNALPLAKDRTRLYFHHPGAAFIETIDFWGLPNLNDFGWDNPTTQVSSRWMRYHIQGGLEVLSQMLDVYDITQNAKFARHEAIPFGDAIVTYYGGHWPRDETGKIRMVPAQSLETYQLDAVNPTPDIAGLKNVLPRLLLLPHGLTSSEQRSRWQNILSSLPPIPTGKTDSGKLPPLGRGDPNGKVIILPAERYGAPKNVENPELYVVFPYRLYGIGKPGLALARNSFYARLFPQDTCWGQDGIEAAMLGLTGTAMRASVDEFTHYGDQRFLWFWRPAHDWIPDLDNGGAGMMTLESMLMQTDGKRILLLPAWPKKWTADFKLHAPYRTTVSGHVENGAVTDLKVVPASRAKDVVILSSEVVPD
jgi:alpha-L-fucosidase 2